MDASALERELDRFEPARDLREAWTPPSSWYVGADFLELERRAVFARRWQLACRAEQLQRAGSYVAGDAGRLPWLVLRHPDGALRAFHNACRHHAAEVACGAGRLEALVCPYHGWRYELDGRLASAPGLGGVRGFAREDLGLRPLAVAELGPLVLVCADPQVAPLHDGCGDLWTRLDGTGWERLRFAERRSWELDCNWKVFVDNYLDGGYHVAVAHRSLAANLDLSGYQSELLPDASVQTSPGRAGESDRRVGDAALYAWVHPGLMINRYGPALDVDHVVPLGPERTRVVMDFWFEEGLDERFVAESLAESARIQEEDVALCESVQRGLASPAYERGRYSAAHEAPMLHFHRLLAGDLRAGLAALSQARRS